MHLLVFYDEVSALYVPEVALGIVRRILYVPQRLNALEMPHIYYRNPRDKCQHVREIR
jgi:hypothetical protein